MIPAGLHELEMPCPRCGCLAVPPLAESTLIVAWYTCPHCDYDWSARVRDGRPVQMPIDAPGHRPLRLPPT